MLIIIIGKSETLDEKLKSILAQFEFVYQIQYWEDEGVPFKSHLHVPERHPITGYIFCEREDEGHVFKVRSYHIQGVHFYIAGYTFCMFKLNSKNWYTLRSIECI